MAKPANYAVLFAGGGGLKSNHSRYFDSAKSNYEALLSRGVKAENITILYADGVKQGTTSEDFYTHLSINDLFEGLNGKPVDVNKLTD